MERYWIWFSELPYVGPVTQKKLLETFAHPQQIYGASETALQATKGISKQAIQSIISHRSLHESEQILETTQNKNIKLLTYNDPNYPDQTKAIRESPALLYYIGELRPYTEAVAIVGARRCTTYGKTVAHELASELALQNIPVISGLAKGIDSYAHTACLNHAGYTLAFVASGVDICYPQEHRPLYEKIKATGAILSAYPPGTRPIPQHFLARNALISAWATKIVIVEAGERSGSLTTANFARKQGKQLYAVPHPIHAITGKGTNRLLAEGGEGEGAQPYLNYSSLNLPLNKRLIKQTEQKQPTDELELKIIEQLSEQPLPIPMLARQIDLSEDPLRNKLFDLELAGKVFVRADIVSMKE